jgi:hypothetical protein
MPWRAMMYLFGHACQFVQRGNNREACFVELENDLYFLELRKEHDKRYGVAVHG